MNNNIYSVMETALRCKDKFDSDNRKRKLNKSVKNESSNDRTSECSLKKRKGTNGETSDSNVKESSIKIPAVIKSDKKKTVVNKCANKSKRKIKSCQIVNGNKFKTSNSRVNEVTLSREAVLSSIQLLEKTHESKNLPSTKESCRRVSVECGERIWNSATNILDHVRLCILKHDWRMLSHLLQLLLKRDKMYEPFIKEVRKISFF